MSIRIFFLGLIAAAGMMMASSAEAATGWTTAAVNMRTCASARCPRILTIPAGAVVRVYYCSRWCSVRYAGRRGFVYGRYIALSGYHVPPVVVYPPPIIVYPPRRYPPPRDYPPPGAYPPPDWPSPPTNRLPRVPPPPG